MSVDDARSVSNTVAPSTAIYSSQGGLGDMALHPDFEANDLVYISNAETLDPGATFGAILSPAKLDRSGDAPKLVEIDKVWTQEPKMSGQGHCSHQIAFGPDGMLYITSGNRQKKKPAQNFDQALG